MQEERDKLGKVLFEKKDPGFDSFEIFQQSFQVTERKSQECDCTNFVKPQKEQMIRVFKKAFQVIKDVLTDPLGDTREPLRS